jgi:DNA-binding transcriptional LysR family regulator
MAPLPARKQFDPDLGLLKSFVAVVDCGGFTAAALRVHRTQSSVSQQIRKLEASLGAQLLERSSNGLQLTEAGEQVLAYARKMLALGGELGDAIAGQRRSPVVRLGITDDYAQLHLSALLKRLARALPHAKVKVTCDLSLHLRAGLARGEYDLVVYKRTNRTGGGALILREPIQWVAVKNYHAPQHALDGDELSLVLFPAGCVYRELALKRLDAIDRRWRVAFESPSTVSVQAAVRAGVGVALLSPGSVPEGCAPVDIKLPNLGDAELVSEFGAYPSAEAECVLQEITELAGNSR